MAVKRHIVKSCCGRKTFIFETDKPIRKFQIPLFKDSGFEAPVNFLKIGVFYIRGNNIIATSSYGTRKISVHCYGDDCEEKLKDFEKLLDSAVNTNRLN